MKARNRAAIAFNYNGPAYKRTHYDVKLRKAYETYKGIAHD